MLPLPFALAIPAAILAAIAYFLSQKMDTMNKRELFRTTLFLTIFFLSFTIEIILNGDNCLPTRAVSWWLSHWKILG